VLTKRQKECPSTDIAGTGKRMNMTDYEKAAASASALRWIMYEIPGLMQAQGAQGLFHVIASGATFGVPRSDRLRNDGLRSRIGVVRGQGKRGWVMTSRLAASGTTGFGWV